MTLDVTRLDSATKLPAEWDALATSGFQRRDFLDHTDRENQCAQRYYVGRQDGRLVAGACVYTIRLDLLTFLHIKSPVRMHVLGVPCSVSAPGLIGEVADATLLCQEVMGRERGLLVGLNLDHPVDLPGLASGRTLPTVTMRLTFGSWRDYLGALRSSYRRRVERIGRKWSGVTSERGPCDRFEDVLHRQYLDVLGHSAARLERLSVRFFEKLPERFHLTVHRRDGRPVAWHVAATDGGHRSFFLGGIDYRTNQADHNYFNLLSAVVREAIEDGATTLDLGQTAEVPKTRLGGTIVEKGMFGWHSNGVARGLLRLGRGLLDYRTRVPEVHVFRTPVT